MIAKHSICVVGRGWKGRDEMRLSGCREVFCSRKLRALHEYHDDMAGITIGVLPYGLECLATEGFQCARGKKYSAGMTWYQIYNLQNLFRPDCCERSIPSS